MLQYFACTLPCELCKCLQHCIAIIKHIDLWKWLSVGVVITSECTIGDKTGRAVSTAVIDISAVSREERWLALW